MSEANNWNEKVIADFRANGGQVGGAFEGAPMVLVHHRGRRSGHEYVNPMMYLASERGDGTIYVFASKGGAPTNPDWYYNLTAAGAGTVELGDGTFAVTVREVHGEEHDRLYAEQARRYPGFAEYAQKTAGVRTIPVLELTPA
jgi:deazaflavin-dependent oxidoreductase (nitroreductase family)